LEFGVFGRDENEKKTTNKGLLWVLEVSTVSHDNMHGSVRKTNQKMRSDFLFQNPYTVRKNPQKT